MISQRIITTPLFIHNASGAWKVNSIHQDKDGNLIELCYRDDFVHKIWRDSVFIDNNLYAYYVYQAEIIGKASLLYFNFDRGRPLLVKLYHYPPRQLNLQQAKDIIIDCINQDALHISDNIKNYGLSMMHISALQDEASFKNIIIEYIQACETWQDILSFL